MLSAIGRQLNTLCIRGVESKIQPITMQKVCLLSKKALSTEKDILPSSVKIMNQDEFIKWRIGSKDDYVARMKKAFPGDSVQELEESYATRCRLGYRDYKMSFNKDFNDPGVMFRAEDFIDENGKEIN